MSLMNILPILLVFTTALAAPSEELITNLPGADDLQINFDQYSGYVDVSEGRHLHYWFVESQSDPLIDPLILWLNGGPGCSSLLGFLTENGPFYVIDSDAPTLGMREYSWNREANVLYLESPACVGFSYDEDHFNETYSTFSEAWNNYSCRTDDSITAIENYNALMRWFDKYSEYKEHDFYITGESYAGIYIPMLVQEIINGQSDYFIKLEGYAIGNGLLSYTNNYKSLAFFSRYHGIIGKSLWDSMVRVCCEDGIESRETCDFVDPNKPICTLIYEIALIRTEFGGLNIYNIYGDCETSGGGTGIRESIERENLIPPIIYDNYERDIELSSTPCLTNDLEEDYLNRADVKEALYIPDGLDEWGVCSRLLYGRTEHSSVDYLPGFGVAGIRGLIYNGDVDMACNFLGNQWDIEDLNLEVLEEHRSWWSGNQIAGYVKKFDMLDFLTVKGSGHMVPEDKPQEAYEMLMNFINNVPYPTNSTLCKTPDVAHKVEKISSRLNDLWGKIADGKRKFYQPLV